MSTRSRIGIEDANGAIKSVYCHHDGYIDGVGATLHQSYTSIEKVEALIALGDLSVLGAEIGEKHDFNTYDAAVCTAYSRDRGEEDVAARDSPSRLAFVNLTRESGGEFAYLFTKDGWLAIDLSTDDDFAPLVALLAEAG